MQKWNATILRHLYVLVAMEVGKLTYIFILELWDDMRSAIDENSSNNVWGWE